MKTVKQCALILGVSEGAIYGQIHNSTEWGRLFKYRYNKRKPNQSVYFITEAGLKLFPGCQKRGPKPKRDATATNQITINLTDWELETIQNLADGAGVTRAEWVRSSSLGTRKKTS